MFDQDPSLPQRPSSLPASHYVPKSQFPAMTADNLIWVRETPKDVGNARKPHLARRSHRKSRSGCISCKKRRVKCDERRPLCGQCTYRSAECLYETVPVKNVSPMKSVRQPLSQVDGSSHATTSDLSAEACLGLHVFSTSIARAVTQHSQAGLSSNSLTHILQHFERTGYSTISSPVGQRILHDKVPQMLMSHPFLLHTVLAFSSSHLEYLSRNTSPRVHLGMTAGYHTQRALNLYSKRISLHQCDKTSVLLNRESSLEEMDALFAACIMLTSLFYHVNEIELPHRSWIVSARDPVFPIAGECDPGIDWLTNTSGLVILLQLSQYQERLEESVWLPFIADAARVGSQLDNSFPVPITSTTQPPTNPSEKKPSYYSIIESHKRARPVVAPSPETLSKLPSHLLKLALSSPNLHIYAPALTNLNQVLSLSPKNLGNFGVFISFPSRLSQDFTELLRRKEYEHIIPSEQTGGFKCTNPKAKEQRLNPSTNSSFGAVTDTSWFSSASLSHATSSATTTPSDPYPSINHSPPHYRQTLPNLDLNKVCLSAQYILFDPTPAQFRNMDTSPPFPPNPGSSPGSGSSQSDPASEPASCRAHPPFPNTHFRSSGPNNALPTPPPFPLRTIPNPDPIALLILGYWFTAIGQMEHWWIQARGKGEAQALLRWLTERVEEMGDGRRVGEMGNGNVPVCKQREEFERAVQEFAGWVEVNDSGGIGSGAGHGSGRIRTA